MLANNAVESTHHEQLARSELDPLIQRDEKGPTKGEERMARAQFLALCWTLFVVGWTDGSTGPLLPRIQIFYDVSWGSLFLWRFFFFQRPILKVGFGTVSWVFVLQCTVSGLFWLVILDVATLTSSSGINSGCIAQYAVERQIRFRQGELIDSFSPATRHKVIVIFQMIVVGCLLQITAFFVQFLALPFPNFVSSFVLGGIGMVIQVSIIIVFIKNYAIFKKIGSIFEWLCRQSSKGLWTQNGLCPCSIWLYYSRIIFTLTY